MCWSRPRTAADDAKAWPVQHWTAVLRTLNEDHPAARIVLGGPPRRVCVSEISPREVIAKLRGLAPRNLFCDHP